MKYLVSVILSMFISATGYSAVIAKNEAYEMKQIRVEYIAQTNRGIIYPIGCELCKAKSYEFDSKTEVVKRGKSATLKQLLSEYSQQKYFTLFVLPGSTYIVKIGY